MARHQIGNEKECLRCVVEYLYNKAPQLVDGFHTKSNKIRHLRNSVLGEKWATKPLNNISTAQYNFDRLVMAHNEIIQLERESAKTGNSSQTYYDQCTRTPAPSINTMTNAITTETIKIIFARIVMIMYINTTYSTEIAQDHQTVSENLTKAKE